MMHEGPDILVTDAGLRPERGVVVVTPHIDYGGACDVGSSFKWAVQYPILSLGLILACRKRNGPPDVSVSPVYHRTINLWGPSPRGD